MSLDKQNLSSLPIGKRMLKGVKWGLEMATGFALFAVLARLLGGEKIFEGGLSFTQTIGAEFAAGLVGGLFLGVSFPILTSNVRVGIIGFVIGAISGFAALVADKGFAGWTLGELYIILPFAAIGMGVAISLRRRVTQKR
ncbi:MAG TPA: hypothetical protein VGO33_02045 [Gemmatimonadaceae bacterium]|jgi:hypothetical protein|nr:hypothetical protein [Gemmatimonadaceae bacterium]